MIRSVFRPARLLAGAVPALALVAALVPQAPSRGAPLEVDKDVLAAQSQRVATVKKIAPAVVAVLNADGSNGGSGVIIDPAGYALTNFHVVQATGPLPKAGLPDGNRYDAVVCGIDKVGDVALIKLLPKEKDKPFPFVQLGDSDKVRAGDWSLAMGNPFLLAQDFTPTVTYGIVSGVNRYQPPEGKGFLEYTDCIQIETSINPGNSGGPLFNMNGELIGINGRGSFEKRGRVNSGVGYAISINQIKNFMGHLRAGIDVDHATLGAAIGSANPDAELEKMVVKQILDESDAFRRGLREGDQLMKFGLKPDPSVTSTNQYKNLLGIYPNGWRVPLTVRTAKDGKQAEILARLMPNQTKEVEKPNQPPMGGPPAPPAPPIPKGPIGGGGEAAKLYEARKGFSNWHFNVQERDRLLAAFKKHGDFTAVPHKWTIDGKFEMVDRNGPMQVVVTENDKAEGFVSLKLNVTTTLEPLAPQQDLKRLQEPLNSGGLMMALYHYHRLLTLGCAGKGFEFVFAHGGDEPFYPYPADGSEPKSLAALRTDCEVLTTKHGSVNSKWYFSKKDATLIGAEVYIDQNAKETEDRDPCELYFSDFKAVDGRKLPHRIEVRHNDKRYAILTVSSYKMEQPDKK